MSIAKIQHIEMQVGRVKKKEIGKKERKRIEPKEVKCKAFTSDSVIGQVAGGSLLPCAVLTVSPFLSSPANETAHVPSCSRAASSSAALLRQPYSSCCRLRASSWMGALL